MRKAIAVVALMAGCSNVESPPADANSNPLDVRIGGVCPVADIESCAAYEGFCLNSTCRGLCMYGCKGADIPTMIKFSGQDFWCVCAPVAPPD